jgi:predicted DNA-binding transcriptional regulator AlpA
MEADSNFISTLIKAHAKPIVKEAMLEFLKENNLAFVSTSAPNSARLLSTDDVVKLIGINRHRVYEMVEEGLPVTHSKPYKFRLEDVTAFIEKKVKKKTKTDC